MTEGRGRPLCPGCGTSRVVFFSNRDGRPGKRTDKKWFCRDCRQGFDVPDRTDEEPQAPTHGLAAQLADPSVTSVDDAQSEG